ncbi:NAD+ diphosphatase [Pseudoduganella flava]|uniref:NAD(+) diphosphatase n=1 Tax=Pseudoduganella flava TaxID=871742 RepID=A0A562PCA0_9BURK|nr:NAD(+) diphosphatase [Pseudoduganella flava]QGZ40163.1 NAD(+) diphosphatase [Pseudoduganella flava]TWI42115.1 NAD+ diphosphatase [Pseudoduganella flava]
MLMTPADFTPLLAPQPSDDPLTFLFHRGRLLLRSADLALPATLAPPERVHPVGLWQGRYCQVAWTDDEALPDDAHDWHGLRALFGVKDDAFVALAGRAAQIAEWARTHRYCGVCGTPMTAVAGERACRCPACGFTAYPRISPAMMVLIRKGDAVLLARHGQSPYQRFTALAGFLEAGESAEEAVHREVMEEVGLKVHNLRYFGSQSWPFPHSLMIAFTAEYLEGDIRTDPAEIAEARWFGPDDEFPEIPPGVSIASELIGAYRPRQAGR